MTKSDTEWALALLEKREKEHAEEVRAARARRIPGKAPFNLCELKKHWAYRFAKGLSPEELAEDMEQIADEYYLAGKRFLSMRAYGEYLMELELYR